MSFNGNLEKKSMHNSIYETKLLIINPIGPAICLVRVMHLIAELNMGEV